MARSRENGGSGQAEPGGEKAPAVEGVPAHHQARPPGRLSFSAW